MTITQIFNKRFDLILWAALIALSMLYIVRCNGSNKKLQAIETAAKTLEQKVKADSIARSEERESFAKEKQEVEGKRQLAVIEKDEADKKVQAQQKTIDRLISTVRTDHFPDTTNMIRVNTAYKSACDSLPAEIDKLNLALSDKDSAIASWSDVLAYEIQIRDEELFKEMNYSDSLKADFSRQTALLKSALKAGKPRGRLLGGISVLGNPNQFLAGAGIIIAYQSKGGKQYQVSPKFIKLGGSSAELFYEGSVLFTIFK